MPKKRPTPLSTEAADLRQLRKSTGLSQTKFAERIGWERTTVVAVENDRMHLGLMRLRQWAAACGYEVRLVPAESS